MMRTKLLICFVLTIIIVIFTGQITFASDQSATYNNYIYPKAAYKQGIAPPFSTQSAKEEVIDPSTGNLDLKITDLTLKGRNGLDLSLTRYYSSTQANAYEPYTYYGPATRYYFYLGVYTYHDYGSDGSVFFPYFQNVMIYNTQSEAEAARTKYLNGEYNVSNGPYTDSDGDKYYYCILFSVESTVNSTTMDVQFDGYKSLTTNDKYYNLGTGWAFDFPYIEKRDNYEYLHYGNAGVWNIDFTSNGGDAHLEKYKFKDIVLQKDNTYTNGQVFSKYVLIDKDGKRSYFGFDGRLMAIKDRFGNEIVFEHTMVTMQEYYSKTGATTSAKYPLISKITDSVGREIVFNYATTQITVTVQDKTNSQNNRTITYNKTAMSGLAGKYILSSVVDAENKTTSYVYDISNTKYSFINRDPSGGLTNYNAILRKIIYPTLGETRYNYVQSTKNSGNDGSMTIYKASERAEYREDARRFNYLKYTYKYDNTGEYDGYPSVIASIPDDYRVKTLVEDANNYNSIYTYNYIKNPTDNADKFLLCTGTLKRDGTIKKSELLNEYDTTTKALKKATNMAYNGTQIMTKTENYEYDLYRNLIGYWDLLANGDTNNTEHKTVFTYDTNHYNLITGKTYKRDSSTTIWEENVLTSDFKAVAISNVYEKSGATGNFILQKKLGYSYDPFGNVSEEKQYLKKTLENGTTDWSSEFAKTNYDYTDTNATDNRDFTGVYLTSKYIDDVKDSDGNLIAPKSGDPQGRISESYKYDWFGNLVEQQDKEGNTSYFAYDKLNRLIRQTNPDETFKTFEYVTNSTDNYVICKDENTNSVEYSSYGNQTKSIFDDIGNLIREQIYTKNSGGVYQYVDVIQYEYDANCGLDWEKNLINGSLTDYTCNNDGRLYKKEITETTNNNKLIHSESYVYDDAVDNGTYAKISKTVLGDLSSPSITTSTYINKLGQVEKQERLHNSAIYTDTFKYDYVGNKIEEKIARAYDEGWTQPWTTKFEYNFANKPTKVSDINGDYITTEYDALGRVTSTTDKKGNLATTKYSTTYKYDNLGRLLEENVPFTSTGSSIVYTVKKHDYDRNGNVVLEKVSNNKPGEAVSFNQTGYTYDSRNRLSQVSNYNNGVVENLTQYYYDALGNKLRQYTGLTKPLYIYGLDNVMPSEDMEYSVTKYEYDQLGKLTKMTDPLGKYESYQYDINGNMLNKIDRNGNTITNNYDGLNRLLSTCVVTPDGIGNVSHIYTYNLAGLRATMDDTSYKYDDLGRLTDETTGQITKEYTYDAADNRKTFTLKLSGAAKTNTLYSYDNVNRLYQVFENSQLAATYEYDDNGNRRLLTYTNGNSEVYNYNLANTLTELINTKVVNINGFTELSHYDYSYYLDGNQAEKIEQVSGKSSQYLYDGLGRLQSETEKLNNVQTSSVSYLYDDYNNRSTMSNIQGGTTSTTGYEYDKNNRLLTETKTTGDVQDITRYSYDDNGNQIYKGTETIKPAVTGETESMVVGVSGNSLESSGVTLNEYNGFNQLTKVTSGEISAEYAYNGDGLRSSKTVNGTVTKHIWDGDQIALELDGAGIVTNKYVRGINLIYTENQQGNRSFYLFNGHGDVVQLTGTDGNVFKSYDYDAFGIEKNPDSADTNVFRYCGEYFDKETGAIYLRARYYDPKLGRFTTEDSVWSKKNKFPNGQEYDDPLSLNLYTYCANNPIYFIDPDGHVARMDAGCGSGQIGGPVSYSGTGIRALNTAVKVAKVVDRLNHILENDPSINLDALRLEQIKVRKYIGELHHIASDKSLVSGFTAQYERIFENAGMSLQDDANLIFLEGHSGAHTQVYKQYVLRYITNATKGLKGDAAKEALTKALTELKEQLIKNPQMPYKGGL